MNIGIFAGPDTGFGDTIRTKKIAEFLREKGYGVVNLNFGGTSQINKVQPQFPRLFKFTKSIFASISFFDHVYLLRLSKNLEKKLQRKRIDILQCETTVPAYIGSLALKRRKTPLIFDMHGLSAEQAVMEGKSTSMVDYIRKIQTTTLKSAHHIFAVSDLHKEYLQSVVEGEKITVIPNAGEVRPPFTKSEENINVVYGGIFAYWENIQTYIQSTTLNADERINFYLLGDGPLKGTIMNIIKSLNAPVKYLGKLSRKKAMDFFDKCHIGALTSTTDIARQIACPIKFFDYLSSGLTVLSEDVGWWPQVVRDHEVGLVVKQNSPADLYEGIHRLVNDSQKRKQMSQNAQKLISEEYNWRKQLSKMEKVYSSLT